MRSSLLRNALYIMLTTGVNSALGYVFWLVVARSYAAEDVGIASALIAAMTVVSAIADLGTSTALIQRLPMQRSDRDWSRTITASLVTASVAGLALALVAGAAIVPSISESLELVDENARHLLLFAGGVMVWSVSAVSDYLFVAERRTQHMFTRNLVFGAAKLAIVAALALGGDDGAIGIFAAWVAGCAVSIAVAYAFLLPRLPRRYRPSLDGVRAEVGAMRGMYAGNYFITLGYLLTTFVLPLLVVARLSAADTAYFYVAWLLGGAFFTVSASVGSALFAEGTNEPGALARQTRSAVRITAALITPLMVVFLVAADPILGAFGEEYADEGKTLLILLTASAIPDAITGLYIARVRAEGRLVFPAAASMGMAAVTLVGAWFLLPSMELDGPGVAFIAAHVGGSVACLVDWLTRSGRMLPNFGGVK